MGKQLSINGNVVDDSVIDKIRKESKKESIDTKTAEKVETDKTNKDEKIIEYNKKIICLNTGIDGSHIILNFKEDFMDDMVESFTIIHNWMVTNHFDALNLGDGVLIYRDSIDEVVNVMKKLNSKLEK